MKLNSIKIEKSEHAEQRHLRRADEPNDYKITAYVTMLQPRNSEVLQRLLKECKYLQQWKFTETSGSCEYTTNIVDDKKIGYIFSELERELHSLVELYNKWDSSQLAIEDLMKMKKL